MSISEKVRLVRCSRAIILSMYRKWCIDGETTSLRPINSKGEHKFYALFVVTEKLQELKFPTATIMTTQIAFLNAQCHVRCCVCAYACLCSNSTSSSAALAMDSQTLELDRKRIEKIACSDESGILDHMRIRRFPTEILDPGCTVGRREACGNYIIVFLFMFNLWTSKTNIWGILSKWSYF